MRIALVHYRLERNGGLETRLFNYVRHFSGEGHDVTLIVSKVDEGAEVPEGVTVVRVPLGHVPKPLRLFFFDRTLHELVPQGNYDLSLSLGRTSHQDMVLCPGNHLGYLKAMGQWWRSPIDLLNIAMDRWAYAHSKVILAASGMMHDELVAMYGVNPEKIRVLFPPLENGRFHSDGKLERQHWRATHGFSSEKRSLLFLTTGNRRKGYPFLLELMDTLRDEALELVVAGVKPMGEARPNVRYIGYCERPEELLWAADLLVHPALYEPFGQVVTESIACGTPVLLSHMVGAKEVVSKDVGMVLNGFSIEEWRVAVLTAMEKDWKVSPDFAVEKRLTTAQHCDRILAMAAEMRSA
jgi:glycosyltransferase involved in cell wall biosynthesis